jgi:hypothetical protein
MWDKTTSVSGNSRKFLVRGATLASTLALAFPASQAYAVANKYTWIKHDNDLLGGSHTSVASSADGSHLIMGTRDGGEGIFEESPLFISTNYGTTWENVDTVVEDGFRNYWQGVDVSDDGMTMVAVSDRSVDLNDISNHDGSIFISHDAGDTWEDVTPASLGGWRSVAIAGDSGRIVAVADDDTENVYVSDDGGDTWGPSAINDSSNDLNNWDTISISDDGSKMLVGGENDAGLDNLVYASTNSGTSWTNVTPVTGDLSFTIRTAMSASGDKMAVSVYGYDSGDYNTVFVSENNGANWVDKTPDVDTIGWWSGLGMSDDGAVMSVLDNNDKMYISLDGGTTWTEEDPGAADDDDNEWRAIDFNASGSRIIVASAAFAYSGHNPALDSTVSFTNAESAAPVVLTLPSGTTITCHSPVKESGLSAQDGAYSYPLGLVDFCFSGADTSNEITLLFVTNLKPNEVAVRKYNPTTKAYSTITGASVTETTYNSQHALQVTYTVTDNGPLDTDPDQGEVADPVGLAVLQVGAPNTGLAHQSSKPSVAAWLAGTALAIGPIFTSVRRKVYSRSTSKK